MKNYVCIFLLVLMGLFLAGLNYLSHLHITAVFQDIRPLDEKIPIYYKGIVVGRVTDKYHSFDSKKTHVRIILNSRKLKLPLNTTAILKKRIKNDKEFDYIELLYPQTPSDRFISDGSYINGKSTIDIKEYIKNQNPEDLDKIKNNLTLASGNLNSSLEAIFGLFVLLQEILQENRDNLKSASYNFKETTSNISNVTKKIDNVILEEQLSNTFNNIENSTGGFHNFTENISSTVDEFNKTIPNINSVVENTKELINNANAISCGIRQTLGKNFGGLRLFFGKVIRE